MLIWAGEPDYRIITAVEGTGDNLTDEDLKDGYVDYWMTSIYKQEGEEWYRLDFQGHNIYDEDGEMIEL